MRKRTFTTKTMLLDKVLDQTHVDRQSSSPGGLTRARVVNVSAEGEVIVTLAKGRTQLCCDVLHTSERPPPQLEPGDAVLVTMPTAPDENGCVLGRIGPHRMPARVVVEAGEALTLRCGDTSIELRADGRLLIHGTDVVTRARRTNRIKGGTVAIN